jgi:hypothetical protein
VPPTVPAAKRTLLELQGAQVNKQNVGQGEPAPTRHRAAPVTTTDQPKAPPPLPATLTQAIKEGFRLSLVTAPAGAAAASSSRSSASREMPSEPMVIDLDLEPDDLLSQGSQGVTTRGQVHKEVNPAAKVTHQVTFPLQLRLTEAAHKYYEKTDIAEIKQALTDTLNKLIAIAKKNNPKKNI